jgi:hypothetical protein
VSEYASWSTGYYSRIISAALQAAGAPPDLVQIVTGYGEAGNALVTGGVGKVRVFAIQKAHLSHRGLLISSYQTNQCQ